MLYIIILEVATTPHQETLTHQVLNVMTPCEMNGSLLNLSVSRATDLAWPSVRAVYMQLEVEMETHVMYQWNAMIQSKTNGQC